MAKAKAMTPAIKTGEKITGMEVLYRVMMLKVDYGTDTYSLQNDAEYQQLLTTMRHNKAVSMTHNGIKYTVAGINAGRDNPSKGLDTLINSVDGKKITSTGKISKAPKGWTKLKWRTSRKANKCPACGMSVGIDIKYTVIVDGVETIGKAPSLSLSHAIPSIYFGATDDTNVTIECRRCNGARGDKMPKEVRQWYERLTFDVYAPVNE